MRTNSRKRARRCCTSASRCGSATIPSAATRTSCATSAASIWSARKRSASGANGSRGATDAIAAPERVLGRAFELRVRVFERGAVRFGVGEDLLFGRERGFFLGILDLGGFDLRELVPQQVELART